MQELNYKVKLFLLVSLLTFFSSLQAAELTRENFTLSSSLDDWVTTSNVSHYDDGTGNGWLFIDRGDYAERTYNFGIDYANQMLDFTVRWYAPNEWETTGDILQIKVNGNNYNDLNGGGTLTHTFSAQADANGNITISFSPITSQDNEDAYIDYLIIEGEVVTPNIIDNANDLCYEEPTYSGMFCMDMGICQGGMGCETTYPLKNKSNDTLNNVIVYYNEDSMGGNMFSSCDVDPSGTCTSQSDIDFGPFGMFGDATEFTFDNPIESNDEDAAISMSLAFNMQCLSTDGLYGTYTKNGDIYRGTISRCVDTEMAEELRDFELRNPEATRNIKGDFKLIGNTVLCVKNNDGECYDYTGNESNTNLDLKFIDTDGNAATYNSSQALIDIPDDAEIVWAALYTQGYLNEYTATQAQAKLQEATLVSVQNMSQVSSIAEVINYYPNNNDGYTYATYAELPELKGKKGVDINGYATVANVKAVEGEDDSGLGNFGAWTIAFVYTDDDTTYKNISVFDGYRRVANQDGFRDVDIVVDGFITPVAGDLNGTLSVFAGEGDKNIPGDKFYLDGTSINTNNAFDSSIVGVVRDPSYTNNQGIDIQNHDVSHILTNLQESATINLTSTQDTYFPSVVVFATELYVPEFCYDYSYKQNGKYFTESNDGTQDPKLTGTVSSSSPVEMGIYIKNFVESDMTISDFTLNVRNLDTAQVKYIANTVEMTPINNSIPQPVPDSSLSTGQDHIHGLEVGTIEKNDYFYFYYDLNPQKSDLDTPIDINASYTLTFNGKSSPRTLKLGKELELCTDNNFHYLPAKSIFNVVHENYYDKEKGGSFEYNNLPTQVVKREGNFKVVALDINDLVTPIEMNTSVAVELFDATAFHDFNASCNQLTSSISPRVWLTYSEENVKPFNQASLQNAISNGMTSLTQSSDFYGSAYQNVGFRVSYNVTNDGNEDLVKVTKTMKNGVQEQDKDGNLLYSINFVEITQDIGICSQDMDNNPNSVDRVPQWCGNNSDKLTEAMIATCMECIYGYNTRFICSRDNFAIRPESFDLRLYDQNQTTKTQLGTQIDRTQASNTLAAGYEYIFQIDATTHLDTATTQDIALGYDGTLDTLGDTTFFGYKWEPRTINTANCNDTLDHRDSIKFANGSVVGNTKIEQVGEYRLQAIDSTWTAVDHEPASMQHHNDANFFPPTTPDCLRNSGRVRTIYPYPTTDILNGCDILSEHVNVDSDRPNLTIYNDYNLTVMPYKYDLSTITHTVGLNNTAVGANSFVYMANITNPLDLNMSVKLMGNITAQSFTSTQLSNYVSNCMAQPVTLTVNKTQNTSTKPYIGDFITLNSGGVKLSQISGIDLNNSQSNIALAALNFPKDMNGTADTELRMNFTREINEAINPQNVVFNSYNAECSTVPCQFIANGITSEKPKGDLLLNNNVPHYYARSFSPRQTYNDSQGIAPVFYEVYCDVNNGCDVTLLQNVSISEGGDTRWRINSNHNTGFGSAQNITHKSLTTYVTGTTTAGNHPDSTTLTYDGRRGRPYTATMQHNPNTWLIYNPFNPNATTNEFQAEFIGGASSWAGKTDTDETTTTNASQRSNRRLEW